MTLKENTKLGLTFGQILSLLSVVGAIITVYVSLNVRISILEVQIKSNDKLQSEILQKIEKQREETKQDMLMLQRKIDESNENILFWLERPTHLKR